MIMVVVMVMVILVTLRLPFTLSRTDDGILVRRAAAGQIFCLAFSSSAPDGQILKSFFRHGMND